MVKMFKASRGFGQIKVVDCVKVSDKCVFFSDTPGDRELKETTWHRWFDNQGDAIAFAKDCILKAIDREMQDHNRRIDHLNQQLSLIS